MVSHEDLWSNSERLDIELMILSELEKTAVLGSAFEAHASEIRARHEQNEMLRNMPGGPSIVNASHLKNVLNILVNQFHEIDGLIARLSKLDQCITKGLLGSTRRFELETLQAGQVHASLFLFSSYCTLLDFWVVELVFAH